ncbi:hypothetical protein [Microvirga ossetica]|uniref:hypothetical protein n=1 Tax=Microvirga ossetica TaxID=1882682 RepID=UPI0012FFF01C|nr:hypothetical protein [Microvirga ossetica]
MIDKVGGKGSIGANVTAFFEAGHVASTIRHCSELKSNKPSLFGTSPSSPSS